MLARTLAASLLTASCLAAQVSLSVQVLNKAGGKPLEGLTAADFMVSQGDRKLEVQSAKLEERSLDLVIVVDKRRWEPLDAVVQDSLGALASRLRGNDRAGLLVAGPGVETIVQPGSAPGALAAALSRSRIDPGLRLPRPVPDDRGPVVYDSILTAVDEAITDELRRRVVLVVGSGYDRSSQASLERVTEAALDKSVIVALAELPEEAFQARGGMLGQDPTRGWPSGPGDARIPAQARIPPPFPTPRPLPARMTRTLHALIEKTGGERSDDWRGGHGLSAMADRQRSRYELVLKDFDARFGEAEVEVARKKAAVAVRQPAQ